VTVIVLAKSPVPGRVKTRLCPPCTPEEAARLAEAALSDTLHVVAATPCTRRVLVLDGAPGAWLPEGFEVLPQRGDGLDERLAHAFADVGTGGVLIGMDTPQLTPAHVTVALRALHGRDADAVLGQAVDGGWWGIGLPTPDPVAFLGVPMSTDETGAAQLRQLRALGLRVSLLPRLHDVDHFEDALAVARHSPDGEFASTVRRMLATREPREVAVAAP
jgi:uncharacterized protein